MFCVNCGFYIKDASVGYCPNCHAQMGNSPTNNNNNIDEAVDIAPSAEELEEEKFYRLNCASIEGKKRYCEKYPNGKYISTVKAEVQRHEYAVTSRNNAIKKALKVIATVIAVPFILFYCVTIGGMRFVLVSKIIQWCSED